jgi:deoxyribonuclease V
VAGCFIAFARGEAGPGRSGDRAWAGAVVWRSPASAVRRHGDHHLRGAVAAGRPRRADDVLAQAAVAGRAPAAYEAGLLARREGALLAAAVAALGLRADVVLVDATGLDHPRRAGMAVHLGAALDLPTVGVTRRPLAAAGPRPELDRGAISPLEVDGDLVAYWVCTRRGVQPVVAHAAWRTSPETAASVVLAASTPEARTPVPLQEARRVAREARALAGAW